MNTSAANTERVGILLVHGIGEQTRYGHLQDEVCQIVQAVATEIKGEPRVLVASKPPELCGARAAAWSGEKCAPIVVEVEAPGRALELHFREVWWADLGEEASPFNTVRFYAWALSMWTHRGQQSCDKPGYRRMRPPCPTSKGRPSHLTVLGRMYLFGIAVCLLLLVPVSLLARLGRLVSFPIPMLLAQYLGDVKMYQDRRRGGRARIEDLNLPPRTSVRRRMVRELVSMATGDYDRWYILGHSLGSVVAFNGLMESEQALANYLDDEQRVLCRGKGLLVRAAPAATVGGDALPRQVMEAEQNEMLPPRPSALTPNDVVERAKLFEKLRGVLTYGSPLERFQMLWPAIIPFNREVEGAPAAFADVQWFNVYDPSDPVSRELGSFDRQPGESLPSPRNFAYRSKWLHLISHIKYLKVSPGRPRLVDAVAAWLVNPHCNLASVRWEKLWLDTDAAQKLRASTKWAGWAVLLSLSLSIVSVFSLLLLSRLPDVAQSAHLDHGQSSLANVMMVAGAWLFVAILAVAAAGLLNLVFGGMDNASPRRAVASTDSGRQAADVVRR